MLEINDLSYSIGPQMLLAGASAQIQAGQRVGIIGANGAGKTTLFRLIKGEIPPDGGEIKLPKGARLGGVSQEVPQSDESLLETVLKADLERTELLNAAKTAVEPADIACIQERLSDISAWSAEARAASILTGLGFDKAAQARACREFSGGWRMRVALAGVLLQAPDYLLLDEPTNYLDLEGAIWLNTYIARYRHTALVISHDRGFLNGAVSSILHLSQKQLTLYRGNYDGFIRQRAEHFKAQKSAQKKQADWRAAQQKFIDRFRAKASKAKQAQARIKLLEKHAPIEILDQERGHHFRFAQPTSLLPPILTLENAVVGYVGKPVLKCLNLRIDQDDRIALLGQNGQGKSTLSKLIAGRLALISGRRVSHKDLRIGYFAQDQLDVLDAEDTALAHLRRARPSVEEKICRAKLAGFGLGPAQVTIPVGQLSGGQCSRLALLLATLDAPHLLILDEPTNHLDIESRSALIEALNAYGGAVIMVSHDLHFLSLMADRLWLVSAGQVTAFEGDLERYRTELLKARGGQKKVPKAFASQQADLLAGKGAHSDKLRAQLAQAETRLQKLGALTLRINEKLAVPEFYAAENQGNLIRLQKELARVREAEAKAEMRWLEISEFLQKEEGKAATGKA